MTGLKMYENGAIVDAEGKLLVRLVYAEKPLRAALFEAVQRFVVETKIEKT